MEVGQTVSDTVHLDNYNKLKIYVRIVFIVRQRKRGHIGLQKSICE